MSVSGAGGSRIRKGPSFGSAHIKQGRIAMAHGLTDSDSMFAVRRPPWHGLGVVLAEPPRSIDEALTKSGLGWQVRQGDVLAVRRPEWSDDFGRVHDPELVPAETADGCTYRANLREDTGELLGIVSDDYRVVPNRDAFAFLDALLGSELQFETAGSLHGGRRVWVLARLPEWVEVGGDRTAVYVYVANSHDGSMAVTASATDVRIVCANTLAWALRRSDYGEAAKRTYRFRHTDDLRLKFAEASQVMDMTLDYAVQFKLLGDRLAREKLTPWRFERSVLERLFAVEDDMGRRARDNRSQAKLAVVDLFRGRGPAGDTSGNSPGTKWAAANAIAEYADFGRRYTRRTDQVQRSFEDTQLKQREGGPGRDTLLGGLDGDAIDARDGIVDVINCGEGATSGQDADLLAIDLFDPAPTNCENVRRFAVDDGPPGRVLRQRLRVRRGGAVTVRLQCPRRARVACRGVLDAAPSRQPSSTCARALPAGPGSQGVRVADQSPPAAPPRLGRDGGAGRVEEGPALLEPPPARRQVAAIAALY
jgi:phage/plasmid-like protein (TIGR03299 family)